MCLGFQNAQYLFHGINKKAYEFVKTGGRVNKGNFHGLTGKPT